MGCFVFVFVFLRGVAFAAFVRCLIILCCSHNERLFKRKLHLSLFLLLRFPQPAPPWRSGCSCPSRRIQKHSMHLLLYKHYTHTAIELALKTDELIALPLLLVCFSYYFVISSHNTFSRRSHEFGDFCCSTTMYLKREIYAQIMQTQML